MKNKTPIICAKCGREFAGGGWDEITTHTCVKPIRTNADRIREMDDEELADFLLGVPMRFMAGDWYSIRNWLKQEVE